MRTVFLRNGNAAYLHKELPDAEYLIEPIYQYDGQEGEFEGGNGQKEIVSEIFDKAPVELIDAEYQALQERKLKLENEIWELKDRRHELEEKIKSLNRPKIELITSLEKALAILKKGDPKDMPEPF